MKDSKKKLSLTIIVIIVVLILAVIIYYLLTNNNIIDNDIYKKPVNPNFAFLTESESTLLEDFNLVKIQNKVTEELLDKYKNGNYTVKNPLIEVNPYGLSPQTALLLFKTDKKEKVTITIKGKHDDDLTVTFEASKDHYIPLYGLYGEYTNKVLIKTESGETNTIDVKVDITTSHGDIEVITNNIGNTNGEFYFGTTSLGTATLAIDNYGEVRWYLTNDYTKGITMLQNGHMLLGDITVGPNVLSTGGVVEVDMLGYIHNQYEIEGGYHHDAYELPNGNLLITSGSKEELADYQCDIVYEIDRKTGKIVKLFNVSTIIKSIDDSALEYGEITGGMVNSVYYNEERNEILLSLRNKNTVMALDYDKGNVKWMLGNEKYWTKAFSQYLIKGVGDEFIYPLGQHSLSINKDGNLVMFNNGYNSYREAEMPCSTLKNLASYGMIYKIDYNKLEASVVYKYGGTKYFSYALSSFNYNKDGHKIFNSGWHFSDEKLYDDPICTQFNNDNYDSYIVELDDDDNVLAEIRIDESKFEVVKAPIYNLESVSVKPKELKVNTNYDFNKDAKYITNITSSSYEKLTESEALAYKENEENPIEFFILNNVMNFQGLLLDEYELKVTLISPTGVAYRYTVKEAGKNEYKKINLNELPNGRYYIYVNLNDSIYNTKQYVEV